MLDKSTIESVAKQTLSEWAEFCYLFGSAASNSMTGESDIDVAIFLRMEKKESFDLFNLSGKLSELLDDTKIDIVVLNDADPIIVRRILETGRLIFDHDSGLRVDFQARSLSAYDDWKISRKEIEDKFMDRFET